VKVIVIGCGRVGSSVALELDRVGWEVTAVDENEDVLQRLGENWSGGFVVGHGMDMEVLREAGIEDADAVVVSTDGDNTNLVIGQVATKRFNIETTVVRVLDPARAAPYSELGLWTFSPTSTAIKTLTEGVLSSEKSPTGTAS
jgi:trk system potassium uptake protein